MKIKVFETSKALGEAAAKLCEAIITESIRTKGKARIILSTGMSQFDTIEALVASKIDWTKVEVFHLDEYVGLSEKHPASFRKYLKERFFSKVKVKKAVLVNGEADLKIELARLNKEILEEDIDLGLIGIGENAHIAFNDPPADFSLTEPYTIVSLNESCKAQQVREGWFDSIAEVPVQAVSMTVHQIMKCKKIISCVPYKVKAQAIYNTLTSDITCEVPATALKEHPDTYIFLDLDSASMLDENILKMYSTN